MNNYKCEDCNGGRNCDCPPMIAPKTADVFTITLASGETFQAMPVEDPTVWDNLWDCAMALLAAIGLLSTVLAVVLWKHGYFEFLIKELGE